MDTLVGYVSFVFDSETIKLKITQQDQHNQYKYDNEETIKLRNVLPGNVTSNWRSIADYGLIDRLLYKKIEVKVEKRDSLQLIGTASLLTAEPQL